MPEMARETRKGDSGREREHTRARKAGLANMGRDGYVYISIGQASEPEHGRAHLPGLGLQRVSTWPLVIVRFNTAASP